MENYFNILNSIDVGEHIEKKNGLSYLSWAWAWRELKNKFPDSTYTIYEDEQGRFYHTDGKTCWVKTGVTVNGIEHIEYLPVMDYRNQSIPAEKVTSFNVNTAIQRSLTKAVARHGLGLYVYAGEDLPEEKTETKAPETKAPNPRIKTEVPLCPVCGKEVKPAKYKGTELSAQEFFNKFGLCVECVKAGITHDAG